MKLQRGVEYEENKQKGPRNRQTLGEGRKGMPQKGNKRQGNAWKRDICAPKTVRGVCLGGEEKGSDALWFSGGGGVVWGKDGWGEKRA